MTGLPFTAVVGADEAKLALLLAAIDPSIGGVLLRGEKGSAKTTLARGLAALLAADAPFVELPIGATEDRVIGSLDLTAALSGGGVHLRRGLLADADGGVLYVDEVNLLPDHLVDALLDVAASGVNRVQREGVEASHPARFLLIGSMNPEEGELRPQLLDRFGLAVDVRAPTEPAARAEAVTRRLAFDRDTVRGTEGFAEAERGLSARLQAAVDDGPAALSPALIEAVSSLCVGVGAEGLRADLVICRAAAALARWEGRSQAGDDDVRRVAALALAHRARRKPLDDHGIDAQQLSDALDAAFEGRDQAPSDVGPDSPERDASEADRTDHPDSRVRSSGPDRVAGLDGPSPVARLDAAARARPQAPSGRRSVVQGTRGRLVGDRPPAPGGVRSVAVGATVRELAARRAREPDAALAAGDLREAVREHRTANLVVLAVDASGSMGADRRMEAAKGAVLGLLLDSYQRRDRVALVTFRGETATVALRPTGSVEVARARLAELPTGGRTPLAAGIGAALHLALGSPGAGYQPLLILVTDGRATAGPEGQDPTEAALAAAAAVRRGRVPSVVVDVEDGPTRLGLAGGLAEAMGGRVITLEELTGPRLTSAVRAVLPVR